MTRIFHILFNFFCKNSFLRFKCFSTTHKDIAISCERKKIENVKKLRFSFDMLGAKVFRSLDIQKLTLSWGTLKNRKFHSGKLFPAQGFHAEFYVTYESQSILFWTLPGKMNSASGFIAGNKIHHPT